MERVGAIMTAAGCIQTLWGESVSTVAFVLSRVKHAGKRATPYELLCGLRPSVAHLRTLGCRAFVLTPSKLRRKLSRRGEAGIFLGYEAGSKACRVLVGSAVKVSGKVVFDETRMEYDALMDEKAWGTNLPALCDDSDDAWPSPAMQVRLEQTLPTILADDLPNIEVAPAQPAAVDP